MPEAVSSGNENPAKEATMQELEVRNLRQAVEFAITTEQLGVRSYRRLARNLENDDDAAELFVRLAGLIYTGDQTSYNYS